MNWFIIFAAPSYSVNTDLGFHLPLRLQQEPVFSMIHTYLWQTLKLFSTLGIKHLILPTTHLWISAGGSDCWPPQPSDYLGNISQKISLWFTKHFLPPLPVTPKVVQLLPAVSWLSPQALLAPTVGVCASGTHRLTDFLFLDHIKEMFLQMWEKWKA